MHRISRKKISIAGPQDVGFIANMQFQLAAQYPVRLILAVGVGTIFCSRLIAPLKDTITLFTHVVFQFLGIRRRPITPALDFNAHDSTLPQKTQRRTNAAPTISFTEQADNL